MSRSRPVEPWHYLVVVPAFGIVAAVALICAFGLMLALAVFELCLIPRRLTRRWLKTHADHRADPLALPPDTWIDVLYRDRPGPITIRRGNVDWSDHECAPELWRVHVPTG